MYRVLIADDEYLMREALERILTRTDGFEVIATVETGLEAVAWCEKEVVDLIFMDIMMPEMNGIEAGKKIRSMNAEVTIVMLSAYSEFDYAKDALKIRAADYLLKPVSLKTMTDVLEKYCQKREKTQGVREQIEACISEKDYKEMYYNLGAFVKAIEEQTGGDSAITVNVYSALEEQLVERYHCGDFYKPVEKPKGKLPSVKRWLEFRLYAMLDLIFRCHALQEYAILQGVFDYIDAHLEENIGLGDITQACNLSQGYLSRIFKKELKISVMEYLHLCKVMQAKWLFCTEKMSVADVAFHLGYNESGYFSKIFKKYEFVTISQYKKELVKESGD